jgi:hypothetical protein|tara:strand:- start:560 stop:832 length:273 start_codon:yes stop_codon:yes gene_type:complete
MKKYLLLIVLAGVFLTSCKKCKDCEVKVEFLSTSSLTNSDCQLVYGMDCQAYFNSVYAATSAEFCGDDLDAAEETADVTTADTRVYWDCK